MSPFARAAVNVIAGTLLPTLAVMTELTTTNFFDVNFWVGALVVGITSLSASLSTQLTAMVKIAEKEDAHA